MGFMAQITWSMDEKIRKQWIQKVRRTRGPAPGQKEWTPTQYSQLCSAHFTEDCFDPVPALKQSLGIKVKNTRLLLPGAVPSIFPRATPTEPAKRGAKRRESTATAKRCRLEVLEEALSTEAEETGISSTEDSEVVIEDCPAVYVTESRETRDCSVQAKPEAKGRAVQVKGLGCSKGVQVQQSGSTVATQTITTTSTISTQTIVTMRDFADHDSLSQVSTSVDDVMSVKDDDPDYEPSSDDSDVELPDVPTSDETSDSFPEGRIFLMHGMCSTNNFDGDILEGPVPEPLCAAFERPNKEDAVRQHVTRFNT
ncbi:hypothetical protein Bbelb_036340 [Branchiostoma belcheri]|nr:hypothetical protein Bbelb_036340 [Branchiostoma belcheri]